MARREPSAPATLEALADELIAAWREWNVEAGQAAHDEQDDRAGNIVLRRRVEDFLASAVCRTVGHADVVWYDVNGLEPDMHCRRCGEDLG